MKNSNFLVTKQNNVYYNLFFYDHVKNFKKLMQFSLKKGKKNTIENVFRNSLFYLAKNKTEKAKTIINQSVHKTTPYINVKTKRKGSKNVYIPKKMKKNFSEFLSSNWILDSAKKRSENQFHKKLINELIDITNNKSMVSKKKDELHKLAAENSKNK